MWAVFIQNGFAGAFSTEEKAKEFVDLCPKDMSQIPHKIIVKYNIQELYTDCYINKLKNGYKTFRVILKKDGTLIEAKESWSIPGRFGWKNRQISYSTSEVPMRKSILVTGLFKDKDEAIAEAQKMRIKSLLDDIWDEKQPTQGNQF